jgi:hypothetical protein
MGEDKPIFTDMLPAVEIADGLVYLNIMAGGRGACTPVRSFEMFLIESHAKLGVWHLEEDDGAVVRKRSPLAN